MPRNLRVLGVAALAAAAAALCVRRGGPRRADPVADDARVVRLELTRAGTPTTVERSGGDWTVAGSTVPAAPCDALVEGVRRLELDAEVASAESSWPAYEVHEASATRLRAWTDAEAAPVLDAWFGKEALGPGSAYARLHREPAVRIAVGLNPRPSTCGKP